MHEKNNKTFYIYIYIETIKSKIEQDTDKQYNSYLNEIFPSYPEEPYMIN